MEVMEFTRLAYFCATTCGINSECVETLPGGMVDVCRARNCLCSGNPREPKFIYQLLVPEPVEGLV